MSTHPNTQTPRDTLEHLVREDPLVHPLSASIACFDFELAPPPHIRRIYGKVFRSLREDHPDAPDFLGQFLPREHAKSESGTVVIPTVEALRDPNIRILIMSETESQATGKLEECQEHIERLAPQFGRKIDTDNNTELKLEREATYDVPTIKAAGFNTGITGGHFDLLIFDDIVSWDTQRTQGRREKSWQKFQDYLNLGSEGESTFLVLGTRKHPDDLYSQLIDGPAWDTTVEKAISDWSLVENGEYTVITDTGSRYGADEIGSINTSEETIVTVEPHRDVDVLWPERWPLETLLMDMIAGFGGDQGTLIWKRENQNDASALQGQVLSADMIHFTDTCPPKQQMTWYAGLDPAIEDDPKKAAENDTDYWSLAFLAHDRTNDQTYLMDVRRRRGMSMAKGLSWVKGVLDEYPSVGDLLVEDAQAQRWFVQTGRDQGLQINGTKSSGKKENRIISMSSRFESGKVKVYADDPEHSSKWQSFLSEWAGFPTASHDDRLDAVEIALRNLEDGSEKSKVFDVGGW